LSSLRLIKSSPVFPTAPAIFCLRGPDRFSSATGASSARSQWVIVPMAAMAWSREPRKKAALLSALALCRCVVAESSLVVHDIQSGVGAMLNGACFGLSNLHGWYFGSHQTNVPATADYSDAHHGVVHSLAVASSTSPVFRSPTLDGPCWWCLPLPTSCASSSLLWETRSRAQGLRPRLSIAPDSTCCWGQRWPRATLLQVRS
jgi:hypothetical protein